MSQTGQGNTRSRKIRTTLFAVAAAMSMGAQAQSLLTVAAGDVSASANDGNLPASTIDGSLSTRWSADATGGSQWIQYRLGACYNVVAVNLAWYNGNSRRYNYSVQTSVDGVHWTNEFDGTSNGIDASLVRTDVAEIAAQYVRITSTGNDVDRLVGLSEAQILSSGAASCPAWDPAPVGEVSAQSAPSYPGQNFSLGGYTLQLPTGASGKIDTKSGAQLSGGYSNPYYFYSDSDGAMVMMDPTQGWGTSGSVHPRTEMRENATWTTGGTNILSASVQVTKVPGTTAIAQIFQGTGPSKPLCELQYSANGNVKLFLENTNQGGSSKTTTITNVPLGTKFFYTLKLAGRTITVKINGVTKTFTMDSSFVGERFYFKAGNYDQTAVIGEPLTSPGTVVRFYGLNISHLTVPPADVTSSVRVTQSGLIYNRFTSQYTGTVTFTNISGQALAGPLQFVLRGLPPNISLVGKTGDQAGSPYITLPNASLAAGESTTVTTAFNNPDKAAISYSALLYRGAF